MEERALRTTGKGVNGFMLYKAYTSAGLKENYVWERPTVNQFLKKNTNFKGVIMVRGHVFTVKDGTVYGNCDDADRKRARVIRTYTL